MVAGRQPFLTWLWQARN